MLRVESCELRVVSGERDLTGVSRVEKRGRSRGSVGQRVRNKYRKCC